MREVKAPPPPPPGNRAGELLLGLSAAGELKGRQGTVGGAALEGGGDEVVEI